VRISGDLLRLGRTPAGDFAQSALALLQSSSSSDHVAVEDLGARHPELAAGNNEACGALLLPLVSGEGDAILWLRPELVRNIIWGGDPAEHKTLNPAGATISPRASFAAWKETVKGHSAPWTEVDLAQAREARNAIQAEVAKRSAAALREAHAQLGLIVEHSSDVIMLIGLDGMRRYVSPSVERMLGWRPEELVGSAPLGVIAAPDITHPDDQQIFIDARNALQDGSGGDFSMCFRMLRREGSWLWVDGRARLHGGAQNQAPNAVVVALHDATARKAAEDNLNVALEQMGLMAATDGLTGLFNRRHFDVVAEVEWRRCGRQHQPLSMLLLDVDHFKLFNDRYGHIAGDECLRAIASQLTAAAGRPGDLAARFGGEEFLILMPFTDRRGAMCVAERVRKLVLELAIAHAASPTSDVVTVSVGVATASLMDSASGPKNFGAVLAAADVALYRAKSEGRNRVVMAPE
jgi:diguanylate cyclase (GGDEF)-like protein/PAS domain S-box-containing protein